MKKIILLGFMLMFLLTFSIAGNSLPDDNAFWNKVFPKLAEFQLYRAIQTKPAAYAYNDLEPSIDAKTMEIHYSKHHLTYTRNMIDSIAGTDYASKPLFPTL